MVIGFVCAKLQQVSPLAASAYLLQLLMMPICVGLGADGTEVVVVIIAVGVPMHY